MFGRLDMEDHSRWYVGRIAVEDAVHTPLVVDWRAPVSEPFYRATAVEPMNVVRRRHLISRKGRELVGLDDEVFDQEAIDEAGLPVAGEGALLAALERNRTGRMGDIVATIQAEQDEAIRAELAGPLVVAGGPGTGKTAVALHRAAYLLYTFRRRLGAQGVLLVGPSPVFIRYIEHVLPSLGEQDVQLSTIGGLRPSLRVRATEPYATAALKGDARMVKVVERAVKDRERPLRTEFTLVLDGLQLRVRRRETVRLVESVQRRRGLHNELRPHLTQRFIDLLVARYKAAAVRSYQRRDTDSPPDNVTSLFDRDSSLDVGVAGALVRGEAPPEGWERELRARLRARPEVKEALDRMWPVLSGADLMNDLFGFTALVRSAGDGVLTDAEQALLHRARNREIPNVRWTEDDVALIDEADARLGPVEAARPRLRRARGGDGDVESASRVIEELGLEGFTDAATLARRNGSAASTNGSDASNEPRTFGHVLVDEAQDLSAMQWRMLARRCPSGSMTLVGDPGQASRPGALASWPEVLAHLPQHNAARFVTLTINYRTPAEVMDVAARLLAVAAPTVEPSRSVRSTGEQPRFVATTSSALVADTIAQVRAALERTGTVAVIAPPTLHPAIIGGLAGVGASSEATDALDAAVAVLEPAEAKGLEFDHVVVVEPAQLVSADRTGLRLLYMSITRTTKTLTVVHAEALPEGLTLRA
jgi:DNA helicase IV